VNLVDAGAWHSDEIPVTRQLTALPHLLALVNTGRLVDNSADAPQLIADYYFASIVRNGSLVVISFSCCYPKGINVPSCGKPT
jgi:hypothetical protein